MKDQHRRSTCRRCGRHKKVVGRISQAGNCLECATRLLTENMIGISTRSGDAHERRLAGYRRMLQRSPGVIPPPPAG